jgi:tRNA(adenine34) deaminase
MPSLQMSDPNCMQAALELAAAALKGGEFPVGCVIAQGSRIVACGTRRGTAQGRVNEVDHAELVALRCLTDNPKIRPGEYRNLTLFTTMEPCLMCFGAILISGIGRIVFAYEDVMGGGTRCDLSSLAPLYRERDIDIVADVLRGESLTLFKRFFSDPRNTYWKGSLLARYTLAQKAG